MFLPAAMALHNQDPQKQRNQPTTTPLQAYYLSTMSPRQHRRNKVSLQRRRKVQAVRLGGKKPRRGTLMRLVRIFKRLRLKWLKLHYLRMLKRLRVYYQNLMKELAETGATIETLFFMESNFIIPSGLTISSCPSRYGSDRPRTISL